MDNDSSSARREGAALPSSDSPPSPWRGSEEGASEEGADVTLGEGGRHLISSMSQWFIPSGGARLTSGEGDGPAPLSGHEQAARVDVTFDNTELNLKREVKRQYIAVAIACWFFLTVVQTLSLVTLNYWKYSPVVIAISIMALSTIFFWRYVWRVLQLPFKKLWQTPYPFAVSAAVLGSLSQHAMFQFRDKYDVGELLIVFFLIQAFFLILVASTYRNYVARWQRFLNHRRLCFDALHAGLDKLARKEALRGGGGVVKMSRSSSESSGGSDLQRDYRL